MAVEQGLAWQSAACRMDLACKEVQSGLQRCDLVWGINSMELHYVAIPSSVLLPTAAPTPLLHLCFPHCIVVGSLQQRKCRCRVELVQAAGYCCGRKEGRYFGSPSQLGHKLQPMPAKDYGTGTEDRNWISLRTGLFCIRLFLDMFHLRKYRQKDQYVLLKKEW